MPLIRKPDTRARSAPPNSSDADALLHAGPEGRWRAARDLATPEGVPSLATALVAEEDIRIREAILTSLARVGTSDALTAILFQVRSDDAARRTGALDALRSMPSVVASQLPVLLNDPDADVRFLACELGRDLPAEATVRILTALLDRESEANVCAAAVDVLAEIGDGQAAPALMRCAARFPSDPFLGFAIKTALARVTSSTGRPE